MTQKTHLVRLFFAARAKALHPRGRGARLPFAVAILALVTGGALSACVPAGAATLDPSQDGELRVVTTTGILADLVRNVAGERAHVTQMVPNGADPHSFEPSLRAVRDVAYADVAFSNYMLLEQHSIIRTLDANLPATSTSVSVAEEAAKQGATILALVEDRSLDTVWLGMRVHGDGAQWGASRSSTVDLIATGIEGPGTAAAYLTTTFGAPEIAFSNHDGFQPNDGYAADTTVLPAAAHSHMSWAFSAPGIYSITFTAALRPSDSAPPVAIEAGTAVFAVGVSGAQLAAAQGRTIVGEGHADLTVDLEEGRVALALDNPSAANPLDKTSGAGGVAPSGGTTIVDLDDVLIEVPARTLTQVPATSGFRFLGAPGDPVYVLPQAVLGKHVHGAIDPHLWHDVHNAAAYVMVIRDALVEADPEGAAEYRRNAAAYIAALEDLDAEVAAAIASIPQERRQLVTTSDAYGYLANAYGLSVAGFLAPNPGVEPSVADRIRLAATINDLDIPAVFLEPNLARSRSTINAVAQELSIEVCPLYGDVLDADASTYIDMMRANAASLAACLGAPTKENS